MSLGLGAVFVAATTAANAGVPADQAGLAAALLNASQQLGGALGHRDLHAIATSRTKHLLAAHVAGPTALASGFHHALIAAACSWSRPPSSPSGRRTPAANMCSRVTPAIEPVLA